MATRLRPAMAFSSAYEFWTKRKGGGTIALDSTLVFMEPLFCGHWFDFIESKPVTAVFVGGLSLGTFALMDNDWHAVALALLSVAGYWLMFRERH